MRFRPAIALFLAYALMLASVLGAVSSASLAGTSHIQLCVTSAQDGMPLPVHSSDHGLCCVGANATSPALLPVDAALAQPLASLGKKIPAFPFREIASVETSSSHPRAPPAGD